MGKKSARKNTTPVAAAAAAKDAPATDVVRSAQKGLPVLKRIELKQLVDSLVQMGFIATTQPAEQWQQYVDMQTLIDRIRGIEAEIRVRPVGGRNNRTQNIEKFKQWAKDNGAQFNNIDIVEFSGYELGLTATKPIAKGTTFVQIPHKLIMSVDNVSPGLRKLMTDIPMIESMYNVRLAFSVLVERLDETSFWKPYLDVLPERYSTVMSFSVNDMQELRGTTALAAALNQCRSIARQYAFIHMMLHKEQAEPVDPLVELLREKFTYDLYSWAVSTVMTRQNSMPGLSHTIQPAEQPDDAVPPPSADKASDDSTYLPSLIPLWDMANHMDGELTTVYNVTDRQVESSAMKDFAQGEQIFIFYGVRRNSHFLTHNGFVYPENSQDSIVLKLGISQTDPLFQQRTKLLQRIHNHPLDLQLLILPAPHFISPDLLAFVRVFKMNAAQLDHWLGAAETPLNLTSVDCALETELETQTWTFLKMRLTLLLRSFATTLADDEATIEAHRRGQNKFGFVKAMLVQYRVIEKRLLTDALEYVSQRTKQ